MRVLTDINPIIRNVMKHFLECSDLLRHGMAAIIDKYVDSGQLLLQFSKEAEVFLVADEDLDLIFLELATPGVNVDTINFCVHSEVVFPHLQRAAMTNANLQNMNVGVPEPRQMIIVGLKVVGPLVNKVTRIIFEVFLEVIHWWRSNSLGALRVPEFSLLDDYPVR